MEPSLERAYLENLWDVDEDVDEPDPPLLAQSQILAQVQERPTYHDMATNHSIVTTRQFTTGGRSRSVAGRAVVKSAAAAKTRGTPGRPSASPPQQYPPGDGQALSLDPGLGLGGVPDPVGHLQAVVRSVETHQREYERVMLESSKASDLVHSMEQEIASLQREAEELAAKRPPQAERLRQVTVWLAERQAAIEGQQQVAQAKQLQLILAESKLRAAETQLDFLAEAREEVSAAAGMQRGEAAAAAAVLREREERAARGYSRRLDAEAAKRERAAAEQDELKQRRIKAGEEGHEKAVERLSKSQARIRGAIAEGQRVVAAEKERRRTAVLGLKGSLSEVEAEVARQAGLYRAVHRQRRELHEKEFNALQEAGLNPYEVFRRRDNDAEAQRQRQQVRSNIEARQLAIAEQLAREGEAHGRALAARQAEKAALERYSKEMGPAAREARVEQYMRKHTLEGVTMLDPTGRLPFDPSKVVVAKTARFGSGGADATVLLQQTRRFPDEDPNELLMPAKYRKGAASSTGFESDEGSYGNGGDTSPPSSSTGRRPASGQQADRYRQLTTRALTAMESKIMDEAKARHKQSIGQAKTMMGREFGGDAFLPSPAAAEFKDFDTGKTYTARVQIINRSYKKNTFRVVGLPVEYGDILEVSYPLPGYLAPGVSSDLTVTFKPKANVDVETAISLLADTGPFEVPIRCRTKRAAVSVSAAAVDFGPGVTIGETVTRTFELRNDGALEVEYRLDSPQLTDNERAMLKSTANFMSLATATASSAAAAASAAVGVGGTDGVEGPPPIAPREERRLACNGFSVLPCVGALPGYSRATLAVAFAPVLAVASKLQLHISYKAPGQKRLAIPSHDVVLTGVGRDLPVFVEQPVIDLKCCMVGHLYRDFVRVRNNGKSAMKVVLVPRPELKDFFEFNPEFGFVQAGSTFPITVRFKPTLAMMDDCRAHIAGPPEEQVFEMPMKLSVPDQRLPVHFTLRAQLTTTDLMFDPPALDFRDCVMSERTGVTLRVTNPGRLPQAFGFVGLPQGVQISPNDGFGYILPGETLERTVSLQPPIPGPQTFSLSAKTLTGRTVTLACRANGVQPLLSLSHNMVALPATPVGDTTTVSVVLTNRTDAPQAFEFDVPRGSDLTLSPHVGEVAAGGRLRVQIDYTPRPPQDEDDGTWEDGRSQGGGEGTQEGNDEGGKHDDNHDDDDDDEEEEDGAMEARQRERRASGGGASPSGAGGVRAILSKVPANDDQDNDDDEGDGGGGPVGRGGLGTMVSRSGSSIPGGGWHRWRQHHLTCHIRPPPSDAGATVAAGAPGGSAATASAAAAAARMQLHLQVTTCAILPDIVLQTELPYVELQQCHVLDYGPVPVAQRVLRTLEIVNQGRERVQLTAEPLDSAEAFACVNAMRPIPPGGTFRLLVSFSPQARTQYLEVLTIRSAKTRVRVALRGAGIAPELQVGPEGVTSSGLDLGDVLCGESASKAVTLTNICPFPLTFSIQTRGVRDPNLAMRPAFHSRPAEGTLAQGESCEVAVVFTPSSQRPYFEDVLQVVVPNQQDTVCIPLRGRGWQEGVFLDGPAYPTPLEDPFMERQLAAATATPQPPLVSAAPASAATGAATASTTGIRELTFSLPDPIYCGETATATLLAGALKSAGLGGAPGEVAFAELSADSRAAGWSLDPAKLPLAAGDKKPVTVSYTAPMLPHPGMAVFYGHAEVVSLRVPVALKGGLPAPPAGSDGRKASLVLRCTLLPGARPAGAELPPSVSVKAATPEGGAAGAGGKKPPSKK